MQEAAWSTITHVDSCCRAAAMHTCTAGLNPEHVPASRSVDAIALCSYSPSPLHKATTSTV